MTNYFRITAYYEKEDISVIIDSNGMFEKLWQFSSYIVQKGLKVLEISNSDNFLDVNTQLADKYNRHVLLRAVCKGKPEYITQMVDGITYNAIKVDDVIYVPEKTQTI